MYNRQNLPENFPYRIGYACLNTILRKQKPSVFCSRTARIATIATKDEFFLKNLALQNISDLEKMILWNDDHNIHFMRMSSEMFPFASHALYGYDVSFAKEELEKIGMLAKQLDHRLTFHPGQTNNLGSPSSNVVLATKRDLLYHAKVLQLMGMPPESVMIIHGGGTYENKPETLKRWEEEFLTLPQYVKDRIVLENDEICYNAEELLPMCEKLNIPLVFDWHHHNINPGTMDLQILLKRIKDIWLKRGIRQKMHYSESRDDCGNSITERRAHSNMVKDISMCGNDVDLMIEAKDKEQNVIFIYKKYDIPVNR